MFPIFMLVLPRRRNTYTFIIAAQLFYHMQWN
jgi:hypothetical protein